MTPDPMRVMALTAAQSKGKPDVTGFHRSLIVGVPLALLLWAAILWTAAWLWSAA